MLRRPTGRCWWTSTGPPTCPAPTPSSRPARCRRRRTTCRWPSRRGRRSRSRAEVGLGLVGGCRRPGGGARRGGGGPPPPPRPPPPLRRREGLGDVDGLAGDPVTADRLEVD